MKIINNLFDFIFNKILKKIIFFLFPRLGNKYWEIVVQFLKFGMVGISNTIVSYLVYCFLLLFDIHFQIANAIGFFVSILNAYYWNSKYVFKNKEMSIQKHTKILVKSFISYGLTYGCTIIFLEIWISFFHISEYIAPLLNLFITTPLNFLLNKIWAFK